MLQICNCRNSMSKWQFDEIKIVFFPYRKLATMWIINTYIKPPRDCNSPHATHICFLRMEFEICNFGVKNFHCGRIVWWSISLSDQEPFAIFHKWAGWPIRCKRNTLTNISHHKPTTIEICTIERLEWKTGNIIAFSETLISLEICNAIAYHDHDDQCQWRHQPPQKQQLR